MLTSKSAAIRAIASVCIAVPLALEVLNIGRPGLGTSQVTLLLLGIALLILPWLYTITGLSPKAFIGYTLFLSTTLYGIAELGLSFGLRAVGKSSTELLVRDKSSKLPKIDKMTGYRFESSGTSRFLRIVHGNTIFNLRRQTNNKGYPTTLDFTPAKSDARERLVVLGDSFSGGYADNPWPDKVNENRRTNQDWQLLNFSLPGIGINNWIRILKHELVGANYEIDGIILPIFSQDLGRPIYTINCEREKSVCRYRYVSNASPDDPINLAQSIPTKTVLVSQQEYDLIASGQYKHYLPLRWVLFSSLRSKFQLFKNVFSNLLPKKDSPKNLEQGNAVSIFARMLLELKVPILVFDIPASFELGENSNRSNAVRDFAKKINASYVDAFPLFKGSLEKFYYKHDAHWNQEGSNYFADFAAKQIENWQRSSSISRSVITARDD